MFRFIFTKAKCGSDLLNLGAGFCTKVEPKIRRTGILLVDFPLQLKVEVMLLIE